MLLSTNLLAGFRCPLCGKFTYHGLSFFTLPRQPFYIACECGFGRMVFRPLSASYYSVRLECDFCGREHEWRLRRHEFCRPTVHRFYCPHQKEEIGLLGAEEYLPRVIKKEMVPTGGLTYFTQPAIMLQVLAHLKSLAEKKEISCQCGNPRLRIGLFPDKLELWCISCHSLLIIYAETKEDLMAVKGMSRIVMAESGFASIDVTQK